MTVSLVARRQALVRIDKWYLKMHALLEIILKVDFGRYAL